MTTLKAIDLDGVVLQSHQEAAALLSSLLLHSQLSSLRIGTVQQPERLRRTWASAIMNALRRFPSACLAVVMAESGARLWILSNPRMRRKLHTQGDVDVLDCNCSALISLAFALRCVTHRLACVYAGSRGTSRRFLSTEN